MGRRHYNPTVAPSTEADKENKVTENIEIARRPDDKNNEKSDSENEPDPQKVAKEQKHCKYF